MHQCAETRANTIIRYTEQYKRQTGKKMPTLADDIVRRYHDMVPKHLREIKFHIDGDPSDNMRANAQIIRRFMDGEHRLPAELEEAWVRSFPRSWQDCLIAELAGRYGLLAVQKPEITANNTGGLAKLLKETGEACEVAAKMIEDGHFGPEDLQHYEKAQAELDDVIVAAMELKNTIFTEVASHKQVMTPNKCAQH